MPHRPPPSRVLLKQRPRRTIRGAVPGLGFAAGCGFVGVAVHEVLDVASALVVPFVLGLVLANVGLVPDACQTGLRVASRQLLRIGVALVGLQVAMSDLIDLGGLRLLTGALVVLVSFVVTYWLGRLLRQPEDMSLLVAAGFSICGVSAAAAVETTVDAKEENFALAVALVTLCGTLAIGVLPLLRGPLGLDANTFGAWAGMSVHDVAQVVATASTGGAVSLKAALVVKLARVLLLAPMVTAVSMSRRRAGKRTTTSTSGAMARRPPIVPVFVLGFLSAVLLRTLDVLPTAALSGGRFVQQLALAASMAALGAGVEIRRLRTVGLRPVVLGLASWAWIGGIGLLAVSVTG